MTEASTISRDTSDRHADRRMLIDGQLVETPATFPSINPATEEVVGHAPDAAVADAEAAVAAARRAFDTTDWSTNTELRIRCLEQLHQALVDHRDELAELTIAEVGATPAMCAGAQLDAPIAIVRLLRRSAEELSVDRGSRQQREPRHAAPPLGGERSRRGGGGDHRLQLPDAARAGQARARAGGRMHGCAEGRTGHAVDHARAR